jgi:hypothetical protein
MDKGFRGTKTSNWRENVTLILIVIGVLLQGWNDAMVYNSAHQSGPADSGGGLMSPSTTSLIASLVLVLGLIGFAILSRQKPSPYPSSIALVANDSDIALSDAEIIGSVSIFKESMDAWLDIPLPRLSGFIHIHNCLSRPIEALRLENLEVRLGVLQPLYSNLTLALKHVLEQPKSSDAALIAFDLDSDRTKLIQACQSPFSLSLSGDLVLRYAGREVSKPIGIALLTEVHRKEEELS